MYTENNWERDLLNGTLGRIVEAYDLPSESIDDQSSFECARVFFDTGEQDITLADLASMVLAYSITIHKSQGSQFKRVIIPIMKSRLLDKALVYTKVEACNIAGELAQTILLLGSSFSASLPIDYCENIMYQR